MNIENQVKRLNIQFKQHATTLENDLQDNVLSYIGQIIATIKAIENPDNRIEAISYAYWYCKSVPVDCLELLSPVIDNQLAPVPYHRLTLSYSCERCQSTTPRHFTYRGELIISKWGHYDRYGILWTHPLKTICPDCQRLTPQQITEQLNHLKTMPYAEYLKSEHWKRLRKRKLQVAHSRCELCNSNGRLHVHHKTYERRGEEQDADLIVLCKKCHAKFHDKLPEDNDER